MSTPMEERQQRTDEAWANYERRQIERERFAVPDPEPEQKEPADEV